jgi:hypothetical protein
MKPRLEDSAPVKINITNKLQMKWKNTQHIKIIG